MGVDELGKAQRTGHAGRAAADDDDVGFHLGAFDSLDWFTENHASWRKWITPAARKASSGFDLFDLFGQGRNHIEQIAHDAVIGNLKDGGFAVFIDGDD